MPPDGEDRLRAIEAMKKLDVLGDEFEVNDRVISMFRAQSVNVKTDANTRCAAG